MCVCARARANLHPRCRIAFYTQQPEPTSQATQPTIIRSDPIKPPAWPMAHPPIQLPHVLSTPPLPNAPKHSPCDHAARFGGGDGRIRWRAGAAVDSEACGRRWRTCSCAPEQPPSPSHPSRAAAAASGVARRLRWRREAGRNGGSSVSTSSQGAAPAMDCGGASVAIGPVTSWVLPPDPCVMPAAASSDAGVT